VKTADGGSARIAVVGGAVTIHGIKVIRTDIGCTNGVIHNIDSVTLTLFAK
jgi:uncharacterized surface protein with fasciclin (FAS1) repeats